MEKRLARFSVNPLNLIAGKHVRVKISPAKDDQAHAYVAVMGKSYQIVLNEPMCSKLYRDSWVNKYITFDDFMMGLLIHEVAHIKYGSLEIKHSVSDGLYQLLNNIIEDSRIEYMMTMDHPAYSRFIRWVLIAVRRHADVQGVRPGDEKNPSWVKFSGLLKQLFYLARFGVVMDGADSEFINFCLPLTLSAMRGEGDNCAVAVKAIYDYLMSIVQEDEQLKKMVLAIKVVAVAISGNEMGDVIDAQKVASSNSLQAASGMLDGMAKGIGSGEDQMVLQEKDSSFYRATVEEYWNVIDSIRQVFKRIFESHKWAKGYDGDINLQRQQEAYIESMTGEPDLNYLWFKRLEPSVDMLLLRDVSGSTSGIKDAYAAGTVAILAALEKLHGVRTAAINFGDSHVVVKEFAEEMRHSRIYPSSDGGTNIMTAMEEISKWKYTAKHRMVFVVTDGEIYDRYGYEEKKKVLAQQHGMKFYEISVEEGDMGVVDLKAQTVKCGIRQLPQVIAKMILEDLGDAVVGIPIQAFIDSIN